MALFMGAAPKAPKKEPREGNQFGRLDMDLILLTTLKNRNNVGLDVGNVFSVAVNLHVVQEWLLGDDTTTETGIVTEKDDTKVGRNGEHDYKARSVDVWAENRDRAYLLSNAACNHPIQPWSRLAEKMFRRHSHAWPWRPGDA